MHRLKNGGYIARVGDRVQVAVPAVGRRYQFEVFELRGDAAAALAVAQGAFAARTTPVAGLTWRVTSDESGSDQRG